MIERLMSVTYKNLSLLNIVSRYARVAPRGFTLIELLVVIAIIGILAAVVLASLGTAKTKATDAAVRDNLNSTRAQAELIASNNNYSYGSICTDNTIWTMMNNARNADTNPIATIATSAATAAAAGQITCHSTSTAWAIECPVSGGTAWCVDSTGFAGTSSVTSLAAQDFSCN